MVNTNSRALIVTSILGYGDLLYLTPCIKFLKNANFDVDVWSVNIEPLINNPDITFLKNIPQKKVTIPNNTYRNNWIIQRFDNNGNNMHTIDFFTLKTCNIMLRNKEKDLVLVWNPEDLSICRDLLTKYDLKSNETLNCNFVAISPVITWPSRTLPLDFYKTLIKKIQNNGDKVVLVGKSLAHEVSDLVTGELSKQETKRMYPVAEFPGAIDLTNQLSLHQMAAFYSLCKMAINSENGNMVISCTNNSCWNLYLPTLNAPEFRLPYRKSSQLYRTLVVSNEKDYFYPADYAKFITDAPSSVVDVPVLIPKIEDTYAAYLKINDAFSRNLNFS
jgi:hypothetical protein